MKFVFVCLLSLLVAMVQFVACRPGGSISDIPDVMCRQPEMRGHCRALIMRWRYDPTTGKCFEFGFGGCDGNGNNFPTKRACMEKCSDIR